MNRQVITLGSASRDLPLSPAVRHGDMVYVSGQVARDPATGKIVQGGVESQTRQVLENLASVLKAANSSLEKVLKVTVFLTDMTQFQAFNMVYREYFPVEPPARSTVGVAALVGEAVVEIEAIAIAN